MSTYQAYIVECPNCKTQNDLIICPTWNEYVSGPYNPPKNICKNCGKELKFTECKILRNKYPIKNYQIKFLKGRLIMNKYKIVALFGEAGSGKDYIQKKIMETDFGKENLSEIISCTTRPPRENEIDGVHYHFIPTADIFLSGENMRKWIEFAHFRDWWYGTSIEHLNKDKINIGVFNIKGIEQILENKEIDCLPIRIICYDKLRLIRQLTRERNPDCMEICRRFQTDYKDFSNISFEYKGVLNDTDETFPVLDIIKELIKEKWFI